MYASNRPPRHQALTSPPGDRCRRPPCRVVSCGGNRFDPRDAAERLLRAQNPDGGWPYVSGQSWTEATALAILALRAASSSHQPATPWLDASRRGIQWLRGLQRSDGGFAPSAAVTESTWVTSLATLALLSPSASERQTTPRQPEDRPNDLPRENDPTCLRAIPWLLAQKSARTSGLIGILQRLLNTPGSHPPPGGAPWYPGTAAWVAPSAFRVFALSRAAALTADPDIHQAVIQAKHFLLLHRLDDGGWNHGGWYAPSEQVTSYPEATGLTLLALRGLAPATLRKSIDLAKALLPHPGSLEAWAWLKMSLVVHCQAASERTDVPTGAPDDLPVWTTRDLALGLLASNASSVDNAFTAPELI